MVVDTEPGVAIWDLRTIDAIESLYSCYIETDMARNAYRNPRAVAEVIRRRMTDEFMRAAQVYAVDVHPGDLEAHSKPYYVDHTPREIGEGLYAVDAVGSSNGEPEPIGVAYEMRWRPKTRVVLFQGGVADGQLVEVRDETLKHGSIEVQVVDGPLLKMGMDWSEDAIPPHHQVVYHLTGWHERHRHWVFTPH